MSLDDVTPKWGKHSDANTGNLSSDIADKTSSSKEKKRSLDTYLAQTSEMVFLFMQEEAKKWNIIQDASEVFSTYRKEISDFFYKRKQWSLLKSLEDHLWREVRYSDIQDITLKWWIVPQQEYATFLHEQLAYQKNIAYYELLVQGYTNGFSDQHLWFDWQEFLEKSCIPTKADDFAPWNKKEKWKALRTASTYSTLIDAFYTFCKEHKLDDETIENIIAAWNISLSDLVDSLQEKWLYGKEMLKHITWKLTYKHTSWKQALLSKKDLDKTIRRVHSLNDFWYTNETFLGVHMMDESINRANDIMSYANNFKTMVHQSWFSHALLHDYPLDEFTKNTWSKVPLKISEQIPMWYQLEQEKPWAGIEYKKKVSNEIKKLKQDSKKEWLSQKEKALLQTKIDKLQKELEEYRPVYESWHSSMDDESTTAYLDWILSQEKEGSPLHTYVVHIKQHKHNLSGLSWTVSYTDLSWKLTEYGNMAAVRDILSYTVSKNIDTYMVQEPDILWDIAEQYWLKNHKEQYKQFWLDMYDPDMPEVKLSPINGEQTVLRFKKKWIRFAQQSFAEALQKDELSYPLFEPVLEIDFERSTIWWLEKTIMALSNKTQETIPWGSPDNTDLVMYANATYDLKYIWDGWRGMKNEMYCGTYIYRKIYDTETGECVSVFLDPELDQKNKDSNGEDDYCDEKILSGDYSKELWIWKEKDQVIILKKEDFKNYRCERKAGSLGAEHISYINLLYFANEIERKDYALRYGLTAEELKSHSNKELDNNLSNALRDSDIFGAWSWWEHWNDEYDWGGGTSDSFSDVDKTLLQQTLDDLKHIWYSDTPPESWYMYRNEWDVISWVEQGKVMLHATLLEEKFSVKFRREEWKIVFPPQFKPIDEQPDLGWRWFRHMFGNYAPKRDEEWTFQWKAIPWSDSWNSLGKEFVRYIGSLIAHEKMHRFAHFHDLHHIPISYDTGLKKNIPLELNQEDLCQIAQAFVDPPIRNSHRYQQDDSSGNIIDLFVDRANNDTGQATDPMQSNFTVSAIDQQAWTITLRSRRLNKDFVFDSSYLEECIWSALLSKVEWDKKALLEKLSQEYKGKFFDVIRTLDTRSIWSTKEPWTWTYMQAMRNALLDKQSISIPFEEQLAAATMGKVIRFWENWATYEQIKSDSNTLHPYSEVVKYAWNIEDREDWRPVGMNPSSRGSNWRKIRERRWPNGVPIRNWYTNDEYFNDTYFDVPHYESGKSNKEIIDEDIDYIYEQVKKWKNLAIPYDTSNGRYALWSHMANGSWSKKTYDYLQSKIWELENKINAYNERLSNASSKDSLNDEVNIEENEEVSQESHEKEVFRWDIRNKMWWDVKISMNDSPAIMFRVEDSKLDGFGSVWVKWILKKKWDGYEIVIHDSSEGDLSKVGMKGKRIDVSTPEKFQSLYRKSRQGMYKMKNLEDMTDFYDYLVGGDLETDTWFLWWWSKWHKQYLEKNGNTLMKKAFIWEEETKAPVRYIGNTSLLWDVNGRPKDAPNYFYKITPQDGGVLVEAVTGNYKFKQKMNLTTFLFFTREKGLDPYTEEEYKAQQEETHEQLRGTQGSLRDRFMSVNTVIAALKKIPEAYKYNMEQKQKFESSRLYADLVTWIFPRTNLFGTNDIIADAESEMDTNIMQVIEWYRDRLSRNESDSGWVHGSRAVIRIEREIFQNYRTRQDYKHRAAGYLLYMCEKEGNLYSRSLTKYAGQWMWVKALLGPEHQKEFLKLRASKLAELKNLGADDEEAMGKYIMMELHYLWKRTNDPEVKKIFGSKFPNSVEKSIEYVGSGQRIDDVAKNLEAKWSIYELIEAADSEMKKLKSAKAFKCLDLISQAAEEPHHHHAFFRIFIQMMVSGVAAYSFSNHIRGRMKKIWRTFGVPMLLMAKDMDHPLKVTRIIDNIAKNKWIPTLTETIQKTWWVPSNWNARDINHSNFAEWNRHKHVIDAIGQRWSKYGYNTMDALYNFDESFLHVNKEDAVVERETQISKDVYMGKVFDWERNEDTTFDKNAFKAALNPLFSSWILNFQAPAHKQLLRKREEWWWVNWQFTTNSREHWKQLRTKIQEFWRDLEILRYSSDENDRKIYDEKLSILFKKFAEYFKEDFTDDKRDWIQSCILRWKYTQRSDPSNSVFTVFSDRLFSWSLQDAVAQATIKNFFSIFEDNAEAIIRLWLEKEFEPLTNDFQPINQTWKRKKSKVREMKPQNTSSQSAAEQLQQAIAA